MVKYQVKVKLKEGIKDIETETLMTLLMQVMVLEVSKQVNYYVEPKMMQISNNLSKNI